MHSSMSSRIAFVHFLLLLFLPFQCAEEQAWISVGFWLPGIPISKVESTLFTHLVCVISSVNNSTFEVSLSQYATSFSGITDKVKERNPSIKTLLSVYGDKSYSLMVNKSSSRKSFIQSSINTTTTYGFDGLDLYWDNPETEDDMNGMAILLKEWRAAANTSNSEMILTATLPFSPDYLTSSKYPVESIKENLNWLHVKTYTFVVLDPYVAAAPLALYNPSANNVSEDYGIRQWINRGLPPSKLVLGLPFYGFAWNLADPKDNAIGAPTTSEGETPHDMGMITYKEIKAAIQFSGGNVHYNANYVVNYWSSASNWIGFDDVEAIKEKVSYAKKKKLLGYYVWQVSNDDNWQLSRAAKDASPEKKDKRPKIILITVAASVLLFGIIIYIVWRGVFRLKEKVKAAKDSSFKANTEAAEAERFIGHVPELRVFSFSDIEEATDRFSNENKIGGGGFGLVYKGILPNGEKIAVKKRSKGSKQGFKEFKNEITLATRLQHVNLVQLLGFCTYKEEQMLIYEYMPHKSLDFYLFDPRKKHLLDWRCRVYIIEGIIQGLLYLQEYSRLTIIHRDLKASNILLDYEMKPKISDFGMAKPFKKDVHEESSRFVGTYGYIPPEYIKNGLYSVKSDVYSFGVLLLQIISGKKISGEYGENENFNLLEYAYKLWKEEKGMEFVDSSLDDTSSSCKLMRCLQVALLCVQKNAEDRPYMLEVSSMLRNEGNSIVTPKQPAYSKVENEEAVTFVPKSDICSQNETAMSPVLGR